MLGMADISIAAELKKELEASCERIIDKAVEEMAVMTARIVSSILRGAVKEAVSSVIEENSQALYSCLLQSIDQYNLVLQHYFLSLPLDSVEVIESSKPQMLSNALVPSRPIEGISDRHVNSSHASEKCFTLDQVLNFFPLNTRQLKSCCLHKNLITKLTRFQIYDHITKQMRQPLIFSATTSTGCADWCDLPTELLYLVFEKLADDFNDLSSCARVCVLWRSIIDQCIKQLFPTPFMLLMYPAYDQDHDYRNYQNANIIPPNEGYYRLFNTQTRKTIAIPLPQLCNRWLCSASRGWLLTSCDFPFEIKLLNPLTRAQIKLPKPWDGDKSDPFQWHGQQSQRLFRVVTSVSTPLNPNSIVLGRYLRCRGVLGFCRPRDKIWSTITLDGECCVGDTIFFKGYFYILYRAYLYCIRLDESNLTATTHKVLKLPKSAGGQRSPQLYLVEMNEELLLISKYMCLTRMSIHKLQVNGDHEDDNKWVRLTSLGGEHAIYLGFLNSVSVYVGKSNGSGESRPDCIYFIDEDLRDIGLGHINVYNLVNKSFIKLDDTLLWRTALNWFRF